METLLELAPALRIDQQININHEDCPAGRDTKARLYIKRVAHSHMFYCHNCGSCGVQHTGSDIMRAADLTGDTTEAEVKIGRRPDPNLVAPFREWPMWAKAWWWGCELVEADAETYGAGYLPTSSGLFLPLGGRGVIKYASGAVRYREMCWNPLDREVLRNNFYSPVVIVEDPVSAYKVHKAGGNSFCLFGTKADERDLSTIIPEKGAVVWLDADTAGYTAAVKLHTTLAPLLPTATCNDGQPKDIELEELRRSVAAFSDLLILMKE